MATLTSRKVSDTYKDLLQVSNSNSGITGSLTNVEDGEGTASVLQLSSSAVNITGAGTLQYGGTSITATAAELNVLDGITATVSELNLLDGVTATTAEINYLDGVTSNIQTQLNSKIEATLTAEQVQDIVGAMFTSNTETRISASYQDADGTIDLVVDDMSAHPSISAASSSDNSGRTYIQDITLDSNGHVTGIATATETVTDTNLTTEEVQDIVGAMFSSNTETRISATYEDGDGTIDLVVDDMTADTQLSNEQVQDIVGAMVSSNTETGITVTYEDSDGTLDFAVASQTDNNFTTTLKNKLDNIESSATADQTDAEIRTAVENASDSNVFTDADHTKLNNIEAGADVTDTDNVRAADALMDDEVDADLKTFALPANTTISTFGKSIVDDADAAAVRSTIGVDAAGTDNSTNVSLSGSLDYITISGQTITRNAIDLAADVTGTLPVANGGTGATSLNNLITLTTHTTGNYVAGISGTSNEIEVSGSGSEGATVTVGLPDDVTIGGDLSVTGGLTVNGSTTTLDVTNLKVTDNLIELNQGVTSNANDSGIIIERGSTGNNAIIMWDESADKFKVGTTTATADSTGNLTVATGTLVAALEGNASTATTLATGRDISLTGDVTGTTATTFDGSGNVSIATSIANNSVDLTTHTTGNYVATLTAGALIDLQNNSGEGATPTIDVDLSELTDGTDDIVGGEDELVYLDNGSQKRKLVSEIKLSQFNNDTPFLTSVPNHSAALLTSGTVPVARLSDIADSNIASDAAIGNSKLANSAITIDGTSVSLGGSITTNNTQLSTEQVQDIVGAMFTSNTETRITASYEDGDGTIDLVVDDMTADTNTNQLTTFTLTADSGSDQVIAHGNNLDIAGGTGISTVVGATDTVTINLGNHSAALLTSGTIPLARISDLADSNVASDAAIAISKLAESAITIDGTSVSLGGSITTNNTQLSTEQVEDIAGGMFSGNTEVGITATYQDGDGTVDFVVDNLPATDDRDVKPSAITFNGKKQVRAYFTSLAGLTGTADSNYQDLLVLSTYSDDTGGDVNALAFDKSEQKIRHYLADQSDTSWGTAKVLAYEDTFSAGTGLSLSGTTFSLGNHSAALLTSGTIPVNRISGISDSNIASDALIAISKLAESAITIDGTSVSLGGSITTNNTQLSTEQVQDIVGAMFSGNTETRIAATYQDGDGTIDLVVDDMTATGSVRTVTAGGNTLADNETLAFTAGSNISISESGGAVTIAATDTQLSTEQVQDIVGAMFSSNTESNITAVYQDGDGTIDLSADNDHVRTVTAGGNTLAASETLAFVAGSNVTISESGGSVTIAAANDNTQLSTEQVQDIVGAMFTGNTETRITATYQDGDGTIDLVVDDLDTDTQLTTENVQDIVGAMFSGNTETRISASYQDGDGTIDLVVDDMTTDTNTNQLTTFQLEDGDGTEVTVSHGKEVKFREGGGIDINWTDTSTGSDGDPYDLTFTVSGISDSEIASDAAIGNSKLANSAITIDGTSVSLGGSISTNNTQLSTEQVQDIVGAMFTSNTETRISATYQDGDGTIDLVVDDMTADTNTQLSTEQVQDIVGAMFTSNTETRISATYQDGDGTIDLVVDDMTANTQLSNSQVRAAVEAASDSNVFTDADHTKLNGIEASADVTDTSNVTSAGALMDSECSNLAAVKGINQALTTSSDVTFASVDADTIDVSGDLTLDADGADIILKDGGTEYGRLTNFLGGLTLKTGSSASNGLIFSADGTTMITGGSIQMSGGFVLDGNTVTGVDDSGEFTDDDAHIMTSAAVNDRILSFGYTTNSGNVTSGSTVDFNNVTCDQIGVNVSANGTDGRIDAGNDIVAFSSSDKRLKENIKPLDNALDKVSKISGVEFDWKPLTKEEKKTIHGNEGHDVGVIAQEIEEVLPEVVQTRDTGYKAVKYEKIVPLLIEAIKELKEEIEELKK
tara:strand:+ start:12893 stop:18703 length:5811 start_codon:yes stop_codon:yes gene_type:complete